MHKLHAREELVRRYARPRDSRVVFTNGCFDLLHRGHAEYLIAARALGDALIVGVNTDDSVRRLKGRGRPISVQEDRAFMLGALEAVDAVTFFDEDTPRELITAVLPDVLVKGGDYRPADVVGREEVEAAGGAVVILPFLSGHSTTGLIDRIRDGAQ